MLQGLASRHSSPRLIGVGPKPIAMEGPSGQKAISPGVTTARAAEKPAAMEQLGRSDTAFQRALPATRPAAEAALLYAGQLMRAGKPWMV